MILLLRYSSFNLLLISYVCFCSDAAHRVHPLAGQGVNLGFGDVTELTQILAEIAVSGGHLNDINYLRTYETSRQRHNVPMMLAIDGLQRFYQHTAVPIVLGRSLGLQLVDAVPPFKVMKIALIYICVCVYIKKYFFLFNLN